MVDDSPVLKSDVIMAFESTSVVVLRSCTVVFSFIFLIVEDILRFISLEMVVGDDSKDRSSDVAMLEDIVETNLPDEVSYFSVVLLTEDRILSELLAVGDSWDVT